MRAKLLDHQAFQQVEPTIGKVRRMRLPCTEAFSPIELFRRTGGLGYWEDTRLKIIATIISRSCCIVRRYDISNNKLMTFIELIARSITESCKAIVFTDH